MGGLVCPSSSAIEGWLSGLCMLCTMNIVGAWLNQTGSLSLPASVEPAQALLPSCPARTKAFASQGSTRSHPKDDRLSADRSVLDDQCSCFAGIVQHPPHITHCAPHTTPQTRHRMLHTTRHTTDTTYHAPNLAHLTPHTTAMHSVSRFARVAH